MKKRMGAIILAAIVAVNVWGTTNVFAASGDYTDKIFSFYVDGSGKYKNETASYKKYNTSSVYVNLTDTETAYAKVQTYGKINGVWKNETVGSSKAALLPLGQHRVRTNIVEHGGSGTYTKLHFCYYMSPTVNVGVWSPDCAGNYPAVN